jgi:HNH endonuclease
MSRKRTGRPTGPVPVNPFIRAMARLDTSNPAICWEWPGSLSRGYGKIGTRNLSPLPVHRVVYEGIVGPIPAGMELDHLCRNRACANPAHLEPVTHRENGRRGFSGPGINARKTQCVKGHPFTESNTRLSARGSRSCRECHRLGEAARRRVALDTKAARVLALDERMGAA